MSDLTIDRVALEHRGLRLAAERGDADFYNHHGGDPTATVWTVRLPELVREELGKRLPGSRNDYVYDHRNLTGGFIRLEGLGDDLDAVRAGLEQIAESCADFLDRLHVARLAVVGELGDAPKIALRQQLRPDDAPANPDQPAAPYFPGHGFGTPNPPE